jgi:hypothetical protein
MGNAQLVVVDGVPRTLAPRFEQRARAYVGRKHVPVYPKGLVRGKSFPRVRVGQCRWGAPSSAVAAYVCSPDHKGPFCLPGRSRQRRIGTFHTQNTCSRRNFSHFHLNQGKSGRSGEKVGPVCRLHHCLHHKAKACGGAVCRVLLHADLVIGPAL